MTKDVPKLPLIIVGLGNVGCALLRQILAVQSNSPRKEGLPIISTLKRLLATGDQIVAIDGVLSGTLGYLCSQLEQQISYSQAILQAQSLGYTEPDPRQDLSGNDVARKALILARCAGWPLNKSDLTVEPLCPKTLKEATVDEFMRASSSLDREYRNRARTALSANKTLRYVAHVDESGGQIGLLEVERTSTLATLRGTDNYIAFRTRRYSDTPLVVSGPGGGPNVTAAGVLGDVIDLAMYLAQQKERS